MDPCFEHKHSIACLRGQVPAAACGMLSVEELWAVQRDAIDAIVHALAPTAALAIRIRDWARDFSLAGADDLPISALWPAVRPIVDAQSGRLKLDWTSPALRGLLDQVTTCTVRERAN